VAWETEPVSITANQALAAEAAGSEQRSAMAEAEEFLKDILASGPVPQKDIKADAEGAGFSWATVRRAKDRLGVQAKRETEGAFASGAGQWVWSLKVLNPPLRCSDKSMSTLSTDEHLKDAGPPLE
jgi:putative DNA primase/helicase